MNFKKSCPTSRKRVLALVLSAGFLSVFSGCSLRDSTDPPKKPVSTLEIPSTEEIISGAFDHITLPSPLLNPDSAVPSIEKPDLSGIFAMPQRTIHESAAEWIEKRGDTADTVLMTPEEIRAFNQRIIDDCPTVVDMAEIPETMDGQTVREMISRYSIPSGDRFTESASYIDGAKREKIRLRLEGVPDVVTVRPAIVTDRCDLKGIPTSVGFHKYGNWHYSDIQETELITGFPVWILHESSDGQFYFVQSYYYAGWIPSDSAAVCSREEFARFANLTKSGQSYITVTAPRLDVNGVRLDMGVTLPYLSEDETTFTVSMPVRSSDGTLSMETIRLNKTDCSFGSLPYTWENTLNQAFAFLGTPYGWGGANGGVDCSGFICAVYRCFGMYLPRNTGEQSRFNGEILSLSGITAAEKYDVFASLDVPASVHWTGHVMLYLGEKDGGHYVIHAPQGGETVTVMKLDMSSSYICAIRIH